jgi:hypothetical protein
VVDDTPAEVDWEAVPELEVYADTELVASLAEELAPEVDVEPSPVDPIDVETPSADAEAVAAAATSVLVGSVGVDTAAEVLEPAKGLWAPTKLVASPNPSSTSFARSPNTPRASIARAPTFAVLVSSASSSRTRFAAASRSTKTPTLVPRAVMPSSMVGVRWAEIVALV